ncbi:hypothetical protein F4561_006079 [Lipingzhangella halophila]|uniref:Uncharacterized protein n=1 Tax=Lipingzhangella halophila TaxID=1783352 RepID=A0A7W7RNE7_9ACTN|nr:hypothetical protein [Lipingzhangella halophila]MBB4935185.1 hypothetical protein [Lipingzhangella halophila]
MSDPYRLDSTSDPTDSPKAASKGGAARIALWAVLVLSAAGSAVSTLAGLPMALDMAFGVVAIVCIVALVIQYVQGRK